MKHGFIKVAAITPYIEVANPEFNRVQVVKNIKEASEKGAKIIVLPELVLSAYTCNDLFHQERLLDECRKQLARVMEDTSDIDALIFVGLPFEEKGKIYNVAAALYKGSVLAFITKQFMPNYNEFYEARYFTPGPKKPVMVEFEGRKVLFGANILLQNSNMKDMIVGCEICEDMWVPMTPGTSHAMAGATIIVNLSASDETVGKDSYRKMLVASTSARQLSAYIYASAGEGESTQDLVFGGHNIIAENGSVLAESKLFTNGIITADVDVARLVHDRRKMTTYQITPEAEDYEFVSFDMEIQETRLERSFAKAPFVPSDKGNRDSRCSEILNIQAMGLKTRLKAIGCKHAVIGISGGLDSTLAVLVTVKAFDMLGIPHENIETITMPCFGTTNRTFDNSCKLMNTLGTHLQIVDIKEAVNIHFRDVKQDPQIHNVTYENCQARERTQVLMDIANRIGGIVIGTGDMSELALGWATYNGDHMSMYGVNTGVPKTLVKHLVQYYADTCNDEALKEVLLDILDTPVSPELIPPVNGEISQKTEDLVGKYELHDFFLYYMMRCGFAPDKIYRIARKTFADSYEDEVILKWLKTFYWRFFSQQFKRSCIPDGPKVGSVALSPRGDLRMPSDASVRAWIKIVEEL